MQRWAEIDYNVSEIKLTEVIKPCSRITWELQISARKERLSRDLLAWKVICITH